MNNKGQSLVTFILIFPVLFLIFVVVYDIGSMVLLKNELDNINYLVLDYGIDKKDTENVTEKIHDLIIKNKSNIDNINIDIKDDKLYITLEDSIDTKISFGNIFNVKSSYVGYMDGDKKIIERNK